MHQFSPMKNPIFVTFTILDLRCSEDQSLPVPTRSNSDDSLNPSYGV